MEKLTKFEEEIMLKLWTQKSAFIKDLIETFPDPKPHYNTVSTMIKILQDKGFVAYEAFGKSYRYYPLISKDAYFKKNVHPLLSNYFNGSVSNLVSFFVKEKKISINELEQLIQDLKQKK
jgi:BlaI family penicillinase repressor